MKQETIEDVPVETFSAEEWRELAIQNHKAKTVYFNAIAELREKVSFLPYVERDNDELEEQVRILRRQVRALRDSKDRLKTRIDTLRKGGAA